MYSLFRHLHKSCIKTCKWFCCNTSYSAFTKTLTWYMGDSIHLSCRKIVTISKIKVKYDLIIIITTTDSPYKTFLQNEKQKLNALAHMIHDSHTQIYTGRYTHNLLFTGMVCPGLWKGLSEEESLELGFKPRHNGDILQTGGQRIPERHSDEKCIISLWRQIQNTARAFCTACGMLETACGCFRVSAAVHMYITYLSFQILCPWEVHAWATSHLETFLWSV